MTDGTLTDVAGIRVGHCDDKIGVTGCTAILFGRAVRGGIHYGGHASGTRACDLFREDHLNEHLHGILLSGGSNYGLDAAGGVMKYLEERKIGFPVGNIVVPIVPSAIIFDLGIGDSSSRPTPEMAYEASASANSEPVIQGSVGAGLGATVGKVHGMQRAMKGGLGSASIDTPYGAVGALAVVNAVGDILDPETGTAIAGALNQDRNRIEGTNLENADGESKDLRDLHANTTLVIAATELDISKIELNRLAKQADQGIVKTHSPSHHRFDGDVLFTISTAVRQTEYDIEEVGEVMEKAVITAVLNAIKNARSIAGISSYSELTDQ